jgi:hypothetical protein
MLEFLPVPEPDDKEEARLIESIAQLVHRYGLEVPAIFFGEMIKPVSFSMGQLVHGFGFIPGTFFLSEEQFHQLGFILDDRVKLEKLIVRIEELARERP